MQHRNEAQEMAGLTNSQLKALAQGRQKGTNNRIGYKHCEESKRKNSEANKAWCAANPDKIIARAKKTRGENHYKWNGGCSKLNSAIRRLTENRKWMDAIKKRDGKCLVCGLSENLEAHHIIPLALLAEANGITSREQAQGCEVLWDLKNGTTVCRKCHYNIHGRKYED
jgi:5-methylcytosine-specific restriction endonuclease McrA